MEKSRRGQLADHSLDNVLLKDTDKTQNNETVRHDCELKECYEIQSLEGLQPLVNIQINRFPMPDAENPYLGIYDLEHNPVITHTELPVAPEGLSQRFPIVMRGGLQTFLYGLADPVF